MFLQFPLSLFFNDFPFHHLTEVVNTDGLQHKGRSGVLVLTYEHSMNQDVSE